ncbi:hypothetical protein E4T56_gene5021 [Termitomyces sp. T112]|nr:hypothetical protein E4T56_gene5021 [Termitomyces sp. T112]
MPNLPHTSEISANMYSKLTEWLEEGTILPLRAEILPSGLEGVTGGLSKLENGQVSGAKLVARPQFTGRIREPSKIATKEEASTNGTKHNEQATRRKSFFKRMIS